MIGGRGSKAGTLAFASMGHMVTHMMMVIYATIVLSLEGAFGADYGELVALAATGWLLFGLGALPAGWLADRWSARGMMFVFFVGLGAVTMLTGFASSLFEIGLGLAAIGLFASIYHPVGLPWLIRSFGERRGMALGINGFFGAAGIALAPVAASASIALGDWRTAFFVPGAAIMALGLAVPFFAGRDVSHDHRPDPHAPAAMKLDRRTLKPLVALMIMAGSGGVVFHSTQVAMPKMFEQGAGGFAETLFGVADTGVLVTIVYLFAGVCQIGVGALADRAPKRMLFMAAYVAQIPIWMMLGWLSGASMVGLALIGASLSLSFQAVEDLLVARSVPSAWLSRFFAMRFVVAMGAGMLAPLLVGFGFELGGGFGWVFVILGGFSVIVLMSAFALPSDRAATAAAAARAAAPEPAE